MCKSRPPDRFALFVRVCRVFIALVKFSTFVFLFCFLYFFSLHFFIAIKSFLSYHSLTNTITQSPHVTKMDSLFMKQFVNSVGPL